MADSASYAPPVRHRVAPVPRKGFPRRLISSLCLLMAGVLIALAFSELLIRLVAPGALFPRFVTKRSLPNGMIIRQNLPNAVYQHSSPEGTWQFRINSNGFRSDRDFAYTKPQGTQRILLLGDSYTVGYEVHLEETFAWQLEVALREAGHSSVEVLNAGMSGLGTAEQYAFLVHEGLRYEPDIVIVAVYSNDYQDTVRSGLYRLDQGRVVQAGMTYAPATGMADKLYRTPGYWWIAQNSQLYGFLNERLALLVKQWIYPSDGPPGSAPSHEARALVAALLEEIARESERAGASVIYLDIAPPNGRNSIPYDLMDPSSYSHLVKASTFYDTCCGTQGVFRTQGHGHWTPPAHFAAARALATLTLERQLLSRATHTSEVGSQEEIP